MGVKGSGRKTLWRSGIIPGEMTGWELDLAGKSRWGGGGSNMKQLQGSHKFTGRLLYSGM